MGWERPGTTPGGGRAAGGQDACRGGKLLLTLALAWGSVMGLGQVAPGRSVKGFQVAEQNPATARQSFLTGRDAIPETRERYRITGLRLEVKEKSRTVMLVEAPECIYDYSLRAAWSEGPLHLTSGDDRIVLDGRGFEWRETNAVLTITNAVRARLRRDLVRPPGASSDKGGGQGSPSGAVQLLEVRSDRFTYEANARQVVFRGHTEVTDISVDLTCGVLTVDLPPEEGSIERIVAEEAVVIKGKGEEEIVAFADRAEYQQKEDLLELTGDARWTMGERSGRGGEIRVQRVARAMAVRRGAFVRLPWRAAPGGMLATDGGPGPAAGGGAEEATLEVASQSMDLEGSQARFDGEVDARRWVAGKEVGRLTSHRMVATVGASNRLERVEAEGEVVLREGARSAAAERAVFTADGVLQMEGHPVWDFDGLRGQAGRLVVHPAERRLTAEPQVRVTLPLAGNQAGRVFFLGTEGSGSRGGGDSGAVEVVAERLDYVDEVAEFRRGVRAEEVVEGVVLGRLTCQRLRLGVDAARQRVSRLEADDDVRVEEVTKAGEAEANRGRLTCGRLVAEFAGAEPTVSSAVAEGRVVWQQAEITVEGEVATYAGAEGVVRLRGRPLVHSPEGTLRDAEEVVWDRRRGSYRAHGRWRLEWKPVAGMKSVIDRPPLGGARK